MIVVVYVFQNRFLYKEINQKSLFGYISAKKLLLLSGCMVNTGFLFLGEISRYTRVQRICSVSASHMCYLHFHFRYLHRHFLSFSIDFFRFFLKNTVFRLFYDVSSFPICIWVYLRK